MGEKAAVLTGEEMTRPVRRAEAGEPPASAACAEPHGRIYTDFLHPMFRVENATDLFGQIGVVRVEAASAGRDAVKDISKTRELTRSRRHLGFAKEDS